MVNQWQQLFRGLAVAGGNRFKDQGDLAHGLTIAIHYSWATGDFEVSEMSFA
jgi:hypothetical protein